MAIRQPIVAGRFYPGDPERLAGEVRGSLAACAAENGAQAPFALMLPHAGHVFCGNVIAPTLAGLEMPENLIMFCPNHTGRGRPLGVWTAGAWLTPLGALEVNRDLAQDLIASGGGFEPDAASHAGEHSIEVILPFLQVAAGARQPSIVPVCVGTWNPAALKAAGLALARVLSEAKWRENTGLVVSSDMNHYEDQSATMRKDDLALARAAAGDADGLLETVAANDISMCGAAPLALALYAGQALGGVTGRLVAHDTSARASGDAGHVVGYAGMRFYRQQEP